MTQGTSSRSARYDGDFVGVVGELDQAGGLALKVHVFSTDSMLYFESREEAIEDDRLVFSLRKQTYRVPRGAGAPVLENGDYEIKVPHAVNEVYYGEVSPETLLWRRT